MQSSPTPLALYHRKREYSEPPDGMNHDHHSGVDGGGSSIAADECRSPTPDDDDDDDDAMSNDVGKKPCAVSFFGTQLTDGLSQTI